MKPTNAIFINGRHYELVFKGARAQVDDCKACDLKYFCQKADEQGHYRFHLCTLLFNDTEAHVFKEIKE